MSGSLGGFSMVDLFRQELGVHLATLRGLFDADPNDVSAAESGMHAAHSLKGAARIVEIAPAEQAATAIEECFLAVQAGELRIEPPLVELLREATRYLEQFEQLEEAAATSPSAELTAEANTIAQAIRGARSANLGRTQSAPQSAAPPELAASFSGDLADLSMMDLFKVEVENQSVQFSNHLLELEGDLSDPVRIEPVMRTAHSVKGAARIVGLDSLTGLAHIAEDVLVAAQKGELALTPDHMDILFRISDIFGQLARMTTEQIAAWPTDNVALIDELVAGLRAALEGETPPAPPAPSQPESASPPPPAQEAPKPAPAPRAEKESAVRVSSESLNRLMSLSAEALVQSRRTQPLSKTVADHKRAHLRMADLIDRMQGEAAKFPQAKALAALIREASDYNDTGLRAVASHQDDLDSFAQDSALLSERLYREVMASRMRPFADAADAFRRMVRDIARSLGKQVTLAVEGRSTPVDRDVLEDLKAPLNHLLRNALDHGIEEPAERLAAGKPGAGTVCIEVRHHAGMLLIEVRDDGRGIDLDKLRLKVVDKGLTTEEMGANLSDAELLEFPFLPGFSTASAVTEVSGRGVGLDVVQTMVRDAGGSVRLSTKPGEGTTAHLHLPVTRSVLRAMVVEIAGEPYAFPLTGLRHCLSIPPEELQSAEGRQYINHDGQNIGLISAQQALELPGSTAQSDLVHVVVLGNKERLYGLEVDRFRYQDDLVIRPLDARLGKVANVSSAAILEDGAPVLIVDVEDLIQTIDSLLAGGRIGRSHKREKKAEVRKRKTVLVVDDSITVRETERKLLENKGYAVDVAVDGVDGWNAVRLGSYDLVVSDVDMPRMTGIELVTRIKKDSRLKSVPVMIVSYKDREEDRMAGLEAGANYYLTKSSFKDEALIEAVVDLIGKAEE
jgi:two-component system, chemotaxis family, sensor histidine kinase and response regulator WspE